MLREKQVGENFADWLLYALNDAYIQARKGKRFNYDEHSFELNAFENLVNLRDDILRRTYKPSRGIAFVIKTPVVREIFAAPFRDRVVHQFLFDAVGDWWNNRLDVDSYSCRKGSGVWYGVQRADKHIRQESLNYTRETYVIKLDLLGYFTSMPRAKVVEKVNEGLAWQFPKKGELYRTLRFLWREVLMDDPCEGVTKLGKEEDWELVPKSKSLFFQPTGRGIVAGNLTSQLASNVYLNELDRYVKFKLGYKHYGRYCDDFYIVVREERYEKALEDVRRIDRFLKNELELTLHPKKRYYQNIKKGLPFLGVVIYPRRIVPGKRVVGSFRKNMKEVQSGQKDVEVIASFMGYMKNLNGYKLTKKVFSEAGLDFEV